MRTYDAIIIGAGISGMYQLYRLRELGLSVRVFEAGSGVGGTWYWNRYPGCRFDSESYSYGYSFDPEILERWSWTEHFAPQPETLTYLNFVADKLDLRRDIEFDSRVVSCTYDDARVEWEVELESGAKARVNLLISATGPLSAPQMPAIPGVGDFQGEAYHTGNWPRDPHGNGPSPEVSFHGKRVGVIGTGATGVQVIQEVSKTARELYVFQRTPNWCVPLHNRKITADENVAIHASYDEIFRKCRESFGSFLHNFDPRSALEVSDEEREAFFEKLYGKPGFGLWLGTFRDVLTDPRANAYASDFVARKIRSRVKDPEVAEKLIPKDHGFGLRRVPMETNYYECYNQPNVHLIDVKTSPIEKITAAGIVTRDAQYDLDMIIYATGFEAVTGALARIEIVGVGGITLGSKWRDGPRSYLGMQTHGFPNFFTLVGPHNGSTFCNIPRCIEQNVEWVTELVAYMRRNGLRRIEATAAAEESWAKHVDETASMTLFPTVDSWFMGVNDNIPGRRKQFLLYAGGFPKFRQICADIAARGYEGFVVN